jgi:hypothetical protein
VDSGGLLRPLRVSGDFIGDVEQGTRDAPGSGGVIGKDLYAQLRIVAIDEPLAGDVGDLAAVLVGARATRRGRLSNQAAGAQIAQRVNLIDGNQARNAPAPRRRAGSPGRSVASAGPPA